AALTERSHLVNKMSEPSARAQLTRLEVHEHTGPPHALALLRARRERPCCRSAAEQCDELAALHSITSSARASNVAGTARPSAFARLRLITSSYFVGGCTRTSAGCSPL